MKQIKLKVPDNWNDISIEQYQKMVEILESNLKEEQKPKPTKVKLPKLKKIK